MAHNALHRRLEVQKRSLKVLHGHMGGCMQVLACCREGCLLAQIVQIRTGVILCALCKRLHSSTRHCQSELVHVKDLRSVILRSGPEV